MSHNYDRESHHRYNTERTKIIGVRFHRLHDKDILDTLEILDTLPGIKSRQAWIKQLIREYIDTHQELIKCIPINGAGLIHDMYQDGTQIYDVYRVQNEDPQTHSIRPGRVQLIVCTSGLTQKVLYNADGEPFPFRGETQEEILDFARELNGTGESEWRRRSWEELREAKERYRQEQEEKERIRALIEQMRDGNPTLPYRI